MTKIIKPDEAVFVAKKLVTNWNKEHVIGVYLGPENDLRHKEVITLGTLDASLIHPRDVFEPAFRKGCAGFILLHNHPTKNLTPSPSDIQITKRLFEAGKILQIPMLDHIIFWKGKGQLSMKKLGILKAFK